MTLPGRIGPGKISRNIHFFIPLTAHFHAGDDDQKGNARARV